MQASNTDSDSNFVPLIDRTAGLCYSWLPFHPNAEQGTSSVARALYEVTSLPLYSQLLIHSCNGEQMCDCLYM